MTMNSIVHDIRMKLFVQQIHAPSSSSSKVGIFSLDKKPRSCDARACDGECSCGLRSKYCRLALIILKGCRRGIESAFNPSKVQIASLRGSLWPYERYD